MNAGRQTIAKYAVGSVRILMRALILNQDLRLPPIEEDLPVEQLVKQLVIEALYGTARLGAGNCSNREVYCGCG